MEAQLEPLFLSALPASAAEAIQVPGREASLRAYVSSALAAWPTQASTLHDFVLYFAQRAQHGEPPPLAHAADLFLAFGCVGGQAEMVTAFHQTYSAVVTRVLMRRGADADAVADVSQALFEKLLLPHDSQPPKLAQYHGHGPLKSWVSTTAATALAMQLRGRRRKREAPEPSEADGLEELVDPEIVYLKERYKDEVERAIARALTQLDDRARTLLRLSVGERMSIDQLGALYRVDRSTVARWLAVARKSLLENTRAAVQTELNVSPSQCDSIVALVRSRLDVSIVRHLSSGP